MMPCTQALVSFSGVVSQTVGIAEVETHLGKWMGMLQFHVTSEKVQPILGYPRLKKLGMTVDCQEDCLHNKNGKRIVYHAVGVKGQDQRMADRSAFVKVTHTKDAKGSKVRRKGDKLLILVGVPVVLGRKESRMVVHAFRVQRTEI